MTEGDRGDLSAGGSGRCLCGGLRYAFDGAPDWQAHCHCESCRRNCSAPWTSYFGVSDGRWRWTAGQPAAFASSPGVLRHFCARCGTPMAYRSTAFPGEMHFYAASLDAPERYRPSMHVHWNERLPWAEPADRLPRHRSARRLGADEDPGPVLDLIRAAFAGMAGRIDPPSSAGRLTAADLARANTEGEVWLIEEWGRVIACMVLTPQPGALYLGKLAVAADLRHQGIGRDLLDHAQQRARALGLPAVELRTRVELAENHAVFRAAGFTETGRAAHPGHDRPTTVIFRRQV